MANKSEKKDLLSTGEFVQCLAASGLFDMSDLLPDSVQLSEMDAAAAAQKLVEAGKLTGFQADAALGQRIRDLRIGNYEILDRLGAGAMGTVYKARHRRMKRIVALKVLSREVAGSEKFALRFQREIETIAKLTHPNIVMAYDADEDENGPFLVMEFVNGLDLASEVKKFGTLSVHDAVDRILQAARGLEYAHNQGIIHRDIKPGNILRDVEGVVKVADLGLARLNSAEADSDERSSLTSAGMVVGTAEYMPPEQAIDSGLVDHRADIYSMGCTLHFLLTGRGPYQAGSIMSMLLKHRDSPIPDLVTLLFPVELAQIFQRMVAKQPDQRHQSMSEVVKDLENFQSQIRTSGAGTQFRPLEVAPTAGLLTGTVVSDRPNDGGSGDTSLLNFSPRMVAPGISRPAEVTGPTIVLVEASRTQAGIIRRFLTQFGAGGIHATVSGREGIEIAKREHASVLICSMHLSDMTGAELARTVLADAGCSQLGVIVGASESDAEHATNLPNSPRVKLLPKPFDFHQLAGAITSVIG